MTPLLRRQMQSRNLNRGEDPPDLTDNEEYLDEEYLDEEMEEGLFTWMRVLIVLAVFIFLVIILLLVRRFTQPSQSSSSAVYVKHEPKYLQLFQKVSSKLGYPIKPGQTLMQSVQYLKNQHIDVAGLDVLLDNILSYHYDTVYRYAPADKVTESNITSELKKIYRQAES